MSAFPKLAAPARRALAGAKLVKLEDLATITGAQLAGLHGMGPNAIGVLKNAVKAAGLTFRAK